ncbi:CDP-glycerol glycerophosphotransferase family protein [Parabacteroides sp.]|uniref:CDP-glycerol glycerophosphotransferase family protein n=1 Tax=Parabacteroides sp. TaxID=1869337 RepID=UPI00257F3522|nr:CDP-glycerol glycerophosphotransferase family protein [Parabacteroides sp.]
MVARLKSLIRGSKFLYDLYYILGSLFLNLLKYLLPVDDKLILLSSYSGRKYDDSPKYIYEQMLKDERFREMRFVWAFEKEDEYPNIKSEKVNINSFRYWILALKARCWITNVSIERGLNVKGRNVFYLNTWHGTPIKKLGNDLSTGKNIFKTNVKRWRLDVLLSQSSYETEVYGRAFDFPLTKIELTGYPRNDVLLENRGVDIARIKKLLGIEKRKKVILYAPTFRESMVDEKGNFISSPPIDFDKWEQCLSFGFVVLFRAHSAVNKILNVQSNSFLIDVSMFDCLNDLMLVSDILISDYSSIFFDYSIMDKPMLCFAYDYDCYNRERGLYFDIRKELSDEIIENENQLLDTILHLDYQKRIQRTIAFRNKYVTEYGHATLKSLDILAENIL